MTYQSTETIQSTVSPGVSFTLKKLSHGRRVRLNRAIAAPQKQIQELRREGSSIWEKIQEASDEAKIRPCECDHPEDKHDPNSKQCTEKGCVCRKPDIDKEQERRFFEILNEIQGIEYEQILPAFVSWGVDSIVGLEVDGYPVTKAEHLLELAPEPLVKEVYDALKKLTELSSDEQAAFGSPSTGTEADSQVARENQNTTADIAKK